MKTKKRDAARRQKNTKLILITSILLILTPLLVFAANDTQDPIIISAAPTGVLNTNNVDLIVYTDENTDCKYDTTNTDYDSMTYSFSTTNTTTHTEGLILSDADYYYYVLCKDYANNTMTNPETISFTIDTTTPTILSAQPSGVLNTDYTTLVIITDENTVCKYDEENESHDDKTYTFEDTNSTSSTQELYSLTTKNYQYFVSCVDKAENIAYTKIVFEVSLPPTFDIDIERNPPIREGTYEVEVISTKNLINAPNLKYKFDDDTKTYDVSLVGEASRWEGYIVLSDYSRDRVGHFIISGKDYHGLTGTKITNGEIFLVDTKKPISPDSLNIESSSNEVEITWHYEGEREDYYEVYRSLSSGVEYVDYYDTTEYEKYIDERVDAAEEYYYRIAAVDEAGNKGELSEEVKILVEGKKKVSYEDEDEPGLSYELEEELNKTIGRLKTIKFDVDFSVRKLDDIESDDEVIISQTFSLIKDSKDAQNKIEEILESLEDIRTFDLSEADFREEIRNAENEIEEQSKRVVKEIEIVSGLEYLESSTPQEMLASQKEARLRLELKPEEEEKYLENSTALEQESKINTQIISVRITYFDESDKEYTLFIKDIEVPSTQKNVYVLEDIPKEVASDASLIIFMPKTRVLKADPIVVWEYPSFSSAQHKYYVEEIIDMDVARLSKTHIAYNPQNFIVLEPYDLENSTETTSLTGNAIFSGLSLFSSINVKDLILPSLGVLVIIALLVYYVFFLKEEKDLVGYNMKNQEQNPKEEISRKEDKKPDIMEGVEVTQEINNYNYMMNLIEHANNHVDNLNILAAKKEYNILFELVKKTFFDDSHIKKKVLRSIEEIYQKISLYSLVSGVVQNVNTLSKEELSLKLGKISNLMAVVSGDEHTELLRYSGDYYTYLMNIVGLKKEEVNKGG